MNASASSVITMGFGPPGSIGLVITLGYGAGAPTPRDVTGGKTGRRRRKQQTDHDDEDMAIILAAAVRKITEDFQ